MLGSLGLSGSRCQLGLGPSSGARRARCPWGHAGAQQRGWALSGEGEARSVFGSLAGSQSLGRTRSGQASGGLGSEPCLRPGKSGGVAIPRVWDPAETGWGGFLRPLADAISWIFSSFLKGPPKASPPPPPFQASCPEAGSWGKRSGFEVEQILFNLTIQSFLPCCWLPSPPRPPHVTGFPIVR